MAFSRDRYLRAFQRAQQPADSSSDTSTETESDDSEDNNDDAQSGSDASEDLQSDSDTEEIDEGDEEEESGDKDSVEMSTEHESPTSTLHRMPANARIDPSLLRAASSATAASSQPISPAPSASNNADPIPDRAFEEKKASVRMIA